VNCRSSDKLLQCRVSYNSSTLSNNSGYPKAGYQVISDQNSPFAETWDIRHRLKCNFAVSTTFPIFSVDWYIPEIFLCIQHLGAGSHFSQTNVSLFYLSGLKANNGFRDHFTGTFPLACIFFSERGAPWVVKLTIAFQPKKRFPFAIGPLLQGRKRSHKQRNPNLFQGTCQANTTKVMSPQKHLS